MFKRFKRVKTHKIFQMHEMSNNREYAELDSMCDELIKEYPNDDKLYGIKANACLMLKKFTQGFESIDKGIELKPKEGQYYAQKAYMLCHPSIKKYNEAIEFYDMAVKIAPEQVNNYIGAARALKELGRMQHAENCIHEGIRISSKDIKRNKKDWSGHYNLANCYDFLEDYDSAEEEYKKSIELWPDQMFLYLNMIHMKIKQKEYGESIRLCEEALKIKSGVQKQDDIEFMMARSYALMEDKERAAEHLKKARALSPQIRKAEQLYPELKEVRKLL